MRDFIIDQLKESVDVKNKIIDGMVDQIEVVARMIIDSYKAGGKLVLCGNGGSAADSQHIVAEMVSRFRLDRKSLPAVALTTNTSILTSIGNDYGYDRVFSRQAESMINENDVFVGISTSGTSKNVLDVIEVAKAKGAKAVLLSGEGGRSSIDCCDYVLAVPSRDTPRIQEAHITILHIICDLVEKEIFKDE